MTSQVEFGRPQQKLLLPCVALLAIGGFLTSQQKIREAAATDIEYVRHEIREEVHGL